LEIRQNVRRVPTGPIIFVVAVLSVLAVALTAWYVGATSVASHSSDRNRPSVTTGFMAPDAAERNEQLQYAQLSKAEATRGH
jgi:hypothetical protein